MRIMDRWEPREECWCVILIACHGNTLQCGTCPLLDPERRESSEQDHGRFNRRDKAAAIDSKRVSILIQPPAGIGAPVCVLGLV